ncbi:MlaA family lipoprotein [Piscinibacter koreensis]|uniref:VacJ family lipoprotein n=1 Tax=Piscinibacter koreensis TaxID=2742824 RepID=A0A7Y6TW49_9BURK|nr:VacJ family lipoprotein [Schlegelella koreensis]NUZ05657.1 VacJ family lipoprotein [Schlegelella koreensis]
MTSTTTRNLQRLALAVGVVLLAGCATPQPTRGSPGQRLDPFEKWNRKVFAFNEEIDAAVLKPVATAYTNVVPQPARRGVTNFFGNFGDAWSAVNNLLQGKFQASVEDMTRVGTNTVFGLFGLLDVASEMGIDHKYEDFGQTLGHYGVGAGAYLVLPLFGPSTVRDAAALPLDRSVSPNLFIGDGLTQAGVTTLQVTNARANLLGASRIVDDISLDKYTFVRDAYLQRRRSLVYDGYVPEAVIAADKAAADPDGAAAAAEAAPPLAATPAPAAAPAPAPAAESTPPPRPAAKRSRSSRAAERARARSTQGARGRAQAAPHAGAAAPTPARPASGPRPAAAASAAR